MSSRKPSSSNCFRETKSVSSSEASMRSSRMRRVSSSISEVAPGVFGWVAILFSNVYCRASQQPRAHASLNPHLFIRSDSRRLRFRRNHVLIFADESTALFNMRQISCIFNRRFHADGIPYSARQSASTRTKSAHRGNRGMQCKLRRDCGN